AFYRDGVADGTGTSTKAVPDVAASFLGAEAERGFRLQGSLDDMRLWNVARTATELLQDTGVQLSGRETWRTGYWKCDEGISSLSSDATAFPTRGTINVPATTGIAGAVLRFPTGVEGMRVIPALNIQRPSSVFVVYRRSGASGGNRMLQSRTNNWLLG